MSRAAESIWELLEQRSAARSDALFALDERGGRVTLGEVHERALGAAARLADDHGIGRGDVVSWQLPNWLDTIVLTLALCRLRAVQNPIVPILRAREVDFITAEARTKLLVVAANAEQALRSGRADGLEVLAIRRDELDGSSARPAALEPFVPDPFDTVRWLFYTSGTTAAPKGARHTDAHLRAASRGMIEALGITADDRAATLLPLTHVGGVIRVVTALQSGSTILSAAAFDPAVTIPYLRQQGATLLPGATPFVHAAFDYQLAHPDLDPLFPAARMFMHGGSLKPPALHGEVKRRLGTIGLVSGYGMTECPMAVWNRHTDPDDALATTEGRTAPGVELRIVDATGTPLPAGTEGEVCLRGPQLMTGYVAAELDADAFDAAGFLRSGDLGMLDEDGRLRITGRLKDVIIRNMENVSAAEVEHLLLQEPSVQDVAVFGLPSATTGELVCAAVVPAEPADPPTLVQLCEHLLACGLSKRKLPERLEVVATLPRNAMEKVDKAQLRRRFATSPQVSTA